MHTRRHLVVACGGTGGHFYPTLAIAAEFERQGGRATLLVAGRHAAEHLRLAGAHGLSAREVPAVRLPSSPAGKALFPLRLWRTILTARRHLRELHPDIVLGMGSFAAVPGALAARSLRLPLVLHEGNARIGRANRWLARWADTLATSLPLEPGQTTRCPQVRTGMPLRHDVVEAARHGQTPADFHAREGLTPGKPLLLLFGGSQGAEFLNRLMHDTAAVLDADSARFQLLHFTGVDDNAPFAHAYRQAGLQASVRRAEPHIEHALLAADLVVCRAGASTISELALFGKSAILVPLPTAADDHQTANARLLEARDAARLLPQSTATPGSLRALLRDWLDAADAWRAFGERIRPLACPAAAAAVATLLHGKRLPPAT